MKATVHRNVVSTAVNAAGGPEAVATHFSLGVPAINKWIRVGRVPSDHILRLCQLGENSVTPHELNPVAYPDDFRA